MIRGRYGLLIAWAVIATLGAAAGAGLFMVYAPLPDPATATSEQLFRWLVTRDLAKEGPATQLAIVRRLDSDFGQTSDMTQEIARLKDSQRAMLWTNIGTLLSPWLLEKVDAYEQLPAAERSACIDRFLDRVDEWSKIGAACQEGGSAAGAKSESSLSKLITERIAECSRRAEPAERQRISEFMTAVQTRWIWRQFSGFSLFGSKSGFGDKTGRQ